MPHSDAGEGTGDQGDGRRTPPTGRGGSWNPTRNSEMRMPGSPLQQHLAALEDMARGIRSVNEGIRSVDRQVGIQRLHLEARAMRDSARQLDGLADRLEQGDLSALEAIIKENIKDLEETITEIKTRLSRKREALDGERSELKNHLDEVREGVPYDEIESSRERFINERKQLIEDRQKLVESLIEEHPCTELEISGLETISHYMIIHRRIRTKQEYDNRLKEYEESRKAGKAGKEHEEGIHNFEKAKKIMQSQIDEEEKIKQLEMLDSRNAEFIIQSQIDEEEKIKQLEITYSNKAKAIAKSQMAKENRIKQSREIFNEGIKSMAVSFISQRGEEGLLIDTYRYDIEIAKKYRRICILDQQLGDHPQDLQDTDIAIFDKGSETQKDLKLLNSTRKNLERLNGTRPYSGSSSDTEMQDDEHKAEASASDRKGKGRAPANKETPPPGIQAEAQREEDERKVELAKLEERGRQAALQLQREEYEQLGRRQGLETRNDERMALDLPLEDLTESEIAESDQQEVQNPNQQGHETLETLDTIDSTIDILDYHKLSNVCDELEKLDAKSLAGISAFAIDIKEGFMIIRGHHPEVNRNDTGRSEALRAYNTLKYYYSELNDNETIKGWYRQAGFDYAQDEQQS